jgi:hypothetical protein
LQEQKDLIKNAIQARVDTTSALLEKQKNEKDKLTEESMEAYSKKDYKTFQEKKGTN